MSRSTMMLLPLVLIIGAIGGAVIAGNSTAGGGDASDDVKALTKRVAALEKRLQEIQSSLPPSQAQEQNAAMEFRKIQGLIQKGDIEEAKGELDSFMKDHGQTKAAQSARRLHDELSVVGKESPKDWHISKWFQGESDIKLDGKGTTLVVFWETWCPHCQREVPKLEALYSDYKKKGLKLVGVTKVNRGATDQKVSDFIKERNVSYPIAKEDGQLSGYFNVAGIPAAAVVRNGKVVWRGHPANLTNTMIDNWL